MRSPVQRAERQPTARRQRNGPQRCTPCSRAALSRRAQALAAEYARYDAIQIAVKRRRTWPARAGDRERLPRRPPAAWFGVRRPATHAAFCTSSPRMPQSIEYNFALYPVACRISSRCADAVTFGASVTAYRRSASTPPHAVAGWPRSSGSTGYRASSTPQSDWRSIDLGYWPQTNQQATPAVRLSRQGPAQFHPVAAKTTDIARTAD
jgi:hypothetical protein